MELRLIPNVRSFTPLKHPLKSLRHAIVSIEDFGIYTTAYLRDFSE